MIENFDNTDIQSFEYETTINSDGNIIGTCELGNATIQMLNDSNEYSSLKGQWIKTIHGSFYIHSVEPVQEKVNIKLSCYDAKYKLDTLYDSSLYNFPLTLKEWRNQIGTNCGIVFDNSDFPNSNLILNKEPYVRDNISNRNVISIIAQAGCSWVDTDKDDIFYFNWFDNTNHVVNDWIELTTEKEKTSPINVVVLGRGDVEDNVKYPKILPDNPVEFRIDNNYILDPQDTDKDIRYEVIQPIYNRVNGFEYLIFNIRTQDIFDKLSIKLGQMITYKDIWENVLTANIMSRKITYLGGDFSNGDNYEITLSAGKINETSTEYSYASSVENRILKVERTTDKQNGIISDVVSQTTEQNQKIAQVTQTVEELNSKISDIADITTSQENNNGKLSFKKINESEPIRIVVRPIGENISYLYPSDNLFPSDDLYLKDRTIRFNNITTNEIFDYELPDDLLYYDSENYDEFILDYDGQSCVINKRVGYNADGTTYVLDNPTTIEYSYPKIELKDGDYEIELLGYDNAYLFARLMAQNIYTTQFATRAEVNSKISQTATSITEEVTGKLDTLDKEVNAKLELKVNMKDLISEINASADVISLKSNRLIIDSNNFKLTADGKITSTSGQIGGYSIGEKSLFANIKDKYTYTLDDYERARNILMGQITPTDEDYERLDLNKDGAINSADLVRISRKRNGLESTEGTVSINTEDANNTIVFEGNTNNIHTSIGMNKITTDIFTSRNISTETLSIGGQSMPKIMSGTSLPSNVTNGAIFLLYE